MTGLARLGAELLDPGHWEELHAGGSPGVIFADALTLTAEPAVAESARAGIQRLADTLTRMLRTGQEKGELNTDVSPEAGAWLLLSLMAGHNFRRAVMPDRARLEAQLSTLTSRD
jgi:hypothetical protein